MTFFEAVLLAERILKTEQWIVERIERYIDDDPEDHLYSVVAMHLFARAPEVFLSAHEWERARATAA